MVKDKYFQFYQSVIGYSHRIRNLPCQDACDGFLNSDPNLLVIAVADGHGSEPLSQIGSKIVVESACRNIAEFVKELKDSETTKQFNLLSDKIFCGINPKVKNSKLDSSKAYYINDFDYNKIIDEKTITEEELNKSTIVSDFFSSLSKLEKFIVYDWCQKVYEDFSKRQERESDKLKDYNLKDSDYDNPYHLYGTTLLATVITDNYWFAIQIGDGTCLALFDENADSADFKQINQPVPDDERCYRNITTSICDSDSYLEFRHCLGTKIPKAIFVGSDGIENSFTSDNRQEELQSLQKFYKDLIKDFSKDLTKEKRNEKLIEKLKNLTEDYSGDDVSIAGLISDSWLERTTTEIEPLPKPLKQVIEQKIEINNDITSNKLSSETKQLEEKLSGLDIEKDVKFQKEREIPKQPRVKPALIITETSKQSFEKNTTPTDNNNNNDSVDEINENIFEAIKNKRDEDTIIALAKRDSSKLNKKYDKSGDTPLILAIQQDYNINVIKALLNNKAEVNLKNNSGNTALFYSVAKSSINEEIVKLLIEIGADINTQNFGGESILHRLIINGNEGIIDYFLRQKGLNINIENISKRTALSYVLENALNVTNKNNKNWSNILNLLLKYNAKLSDNEHDNRLLMNTIRENNLSKIRFFINYGINVNSIDLETKRTALQLAIYLQHKEIAKALLNAGADKNNLFEDELNYLNEK